MISRPVARRTIPVLVAIAALFAIAGCGGSGGGGSSLGSGIVANVNGEKISQAELDEVIQQAQSRLEAQGQKIPAAGSQEYQAFQQNALQYLVEKIQYAQQAEELGVKVTDKQVDERLERVIKQFFGGSEKKYKESLEKQKLTDEQVRDEIRTAQLLPEALFKKVGESATVNDADITSYYNAHPELFSERPSREVAQILVTSKALADEVYAKLKAGEKFATLARKYSIDSSKSVGGKLTIRKGETVPPFEKVALSLKTGAISKPVKSRFGWHIITALGPMESGKTTPLAAARETIRQTLQSQVQSDAVTKWLADLKKKYADKITYAPGFAPPSTEPAPTTTSTG